MNFAKRTIMAVGMMALAVLLVAVLAPNTAHGLVAALVQVTNTTANPVPTVATDNPALTPVRLAGSIIDDAGGISDTATFTDSPLSGPPYTVPAGYRLVVDSVSGSAYAGPGGYVRFRITHSVNGVEWYEWMDVQPVGTSAYQTSYNFASQFTTYADPLTQLTFTCDRDGSTLSVEFYCGMTLSGHLMRIQ